VSLQRETNISALALLLGYGRRRNTLLSLGHKGSNDDGLDKQKRETNTLETERETVSSG